MTSLWDDIRYAFRLMLRQPAFTATAVLLLAIGIGANSAIFSVVDSVLLRPLPYANPESLYTLSTHNPTRKGAQFALSPPEYLEYAANVKSYSGFAAHFNYSVTLTGRGAASRVAARFVTSDYLAMLGLSPVLGRGFAPEEYEVGRNQVAILTDAYWKSQFAGDPAILGKTIRLDDETHLVAGILPPVKGEPRPVELYLPAVFTNATRDAWDLRSINVIARLKPGVTTAQASAELTSIAQRLAQEHPESNSGVTSFLTPAVVEAQGDLREPIFLLSLAVGIVLLITCSNLANLLLIRSSARHREVAIRSAMGASQGRVFLQMITESLTLAVLGGAAGLLVASWSLRAIARLGAASMPQLESTEINLSVVAFTFGVSLLTGVLFGLVPAWQTLRLNLATTLRDESRGSSGGLRRSLLRNVFVVSEVALSVILLFCAGLLSRTFTAVNAVDTGFQPARVLTLRITLPEARYPTPEARATYVRNAVRKLESTPGVVSAGITTAIPMSRANWRAHFTIDGQTGPRETVTYSAMSPHYLDAIGALVLQGRAFAETDTASSEPVILISQAMQRRYFPGQDPLGRTLNLTMGTSQFRPRIVGVVRDIAQLRPEEPPRITIYQPHAQYPWPYFAFAVRTAGDPAAMTETVRRAFQEVDANLPAEKIQPLGVLLDAVLAQRRLSMILLLVFSSLAVLLAAVGLYGVLAVAVAQRVREIAIRMALGAERADILRMVLAHGLGLTAAGLAAGLAAAPLVGYSMRQLLYGVTPIDPVTFGSTIAVVLVSALAASILPAWRASRYDPAASLRAE